MLPKLNEEAFKLTLNQQLSLETVKREAHLIPREKLEADAVELARQLCIYRNIINAMCKND